jgi:hypothetical protein
LIFFVLWNLTEQMSRATKRRADASASAGKAQKKDSGTPPPENWLSQMQAMLKEEHALLLRTAREERRAEFEQFKQELQPSIQRLNAGLLKVDLMARACELDQSVPLQRGEGEPATCSKDVFGGLTVGQMFLLGPEHAIPQLRQSSSLGDLAEFLTAFDQTATAVLDSDDNVVGLLTENDIMRAYFEAGSFAFVKFNELVAMSWVGILQTMKNRF